MRKTFDLEDAPAWSNVRATLFSEHFAQAKACGSGGIVDATTHLSQYLLGIGQAAIVAGEAKR